MMSEFRGDKAVKQSAFCERFLWSQITTGRCSAQKNSVIVYNWFFDVFEQLSFYPISWQQINRFLLKFNAYRGGKSVTDERAEII